MLEIKNGYPVIAGGLEIKEGATSPSGHAWLIHGLLERTRVVEIHDLKTKAFIRSYEETEYYPLCNWGWSGLADGYYLSGAFSPGMSNNVFNEDLTHPSNLHNTVKHDYKYAQQMITGIRK